MHSSIIAIIFPIVLNSCISIASYSQQLKPTPIPNTYRPPYFADSNRMQKVKATQAVVDKLYRDHAATNHFPGMVYGVVVDGVVLYTGTAGYTDPDKKTPVTAQSAFRMASMTKSFTAMAIIQLRD